jgi:hypothetical protein
MDQRPGAANSNGTRPSGLRFAADGTAQELATHLSAPDFAYWFARHGEPEREPEAQETKGRLTRLVLDAARGIWGEDGPPDHMAPKLICTEIRAYLKKQEGAEPDMHDKTITNAVKKIRS